MSFERSRVELRNQTLLVCRAERFRARLKGLLGSQPFAEFDVLHIPRCRAVHTFGMRVPIDIVFVSKAQLIVGVVHSLPPWRFQRCTEADAVWELPAGHASHYKLQAGERWPC